MMGRARTAYEFLLNNLLIAATLLFMAGALLARRLPALTKDASWPMMAGTIIFFSLCLLFLLPSLPFSTGKKHIISPGPCPSARNWTTMIVLFLLLAAAGYIHAWLALQPPADPNHIYNLVATKKLLTLKGRVTGFIRQNDKKSSFILDLSHVLDRDKKTPLFQPVSGKVTLSLRGQLPLTLLAGDEILVLAKVKRIHNYQTPGIFDYVLYMRNKDIYCSGWISTAAAILQLHPDGSEHIPARFLVQRMRQQLARFLDNRLEPISSGLYQALLIGNRSRLQRETIDNFVASGCMHLLAISGLHIGLLAFALYWFFLFIGKQSQWILLHANVHVLATMFTLPPLLVYACMAGLGAPVMRAVVMALLVAAALLLRQRHSLLHLLAGAALLMLVVKPLALYTASFQLSFAAMLGILLLLPPLTKSWPFLTAGQNLNILSRPTQWLASALFLSLAATAATLPFLLVHFNRFSIIGPFMNLLIEPLLCFAALPIGLFASLAVHWFPDTAALLFHLGGKPLVLANDLVTMAAHLPFALVWTITPTSLEIVTYAVILVVLRRTSMAKQWRYPALLILTIGLVLHFTSGLYWTHNQSAAQVNFLDVGHGSSTLIEFPDGTTTLIDGGGPFAENFNIGERIIAPFLWKKRLWRIHSLIITHPDSDHYNGLAFILRHFHPKIIYTNGQRAKSASYIQLLQLSKQLHIARHTPGPGEVLHRDGILCQLVNLGMPGLAEQHDSDNNQSLVTRLTCAQTSFLFPGDIEQKAEKRLIQHGVPLRANVLLAPHHGSRTSSSSAFMQRVAPEVIIVSGKTAWASAYMSRLISGSQAQHRLLVTGRDGTITCLTEGKNVAITTWAENL